MMLNLWNHLQSSFLYLLLVFAASSGMRLPRESDVDWPGCKHASQEVLKQLQKLNVKKELVTLSTVQFPPWIECKDQCDPNSLVKNNMPCLMKIRQSLHHYQELLSQYSILNFTAELQMAVSNFLQLLSKDGGVITRKSGPAKQLEEWEKGNLQKLILLRLQSFAVVAARVFAHCAALHGNTTL